VPGDRPTLAERRDAAIDRRRTAARRRRTGAGVAVVLLVAAGVAACSTIVHTGKNTTTTSTTSPTNGSSNPTTTTKPKPPSSYNVGLTTFDWTDPSRTTLNPSGGSPIPGRVLKTEVRYPTTAGSPSAETAGAAPATRFGPYPVVVFAHGFAVMPDLYQPLLDAWVHAGFVVVSPVFPDENGVSVAALGGPSSTAGMKAELDDVSEPADIVYVLKELSIAVAKGSGKRISGLADMSKIAITGQSDGANVVSALAFNSSYASDWAALPVKPKAVEILSGQALAPAASYASSASSPAVLQVQSTTDTCNGAQIAADLYGTLANSPVHLFETLNGPPGTEGHLGPYTGVQPWAGIVARATTKFLEVELGWHATGLSLASVTAAGTSAPESLISPTITGFPTAPPGNYCPLPTTTPTT
jgi:hypothetical protein